MVRKKVKTKRLESARNLALSSLHLVSESVLLLLTQRLLVLQLHGQFAQLVLLVLQIVLRLNEGI